MPIEQPALDKVLTFALGVDNTSMLDSPEVRGTLSVGLNADLVNDSLVKKRNGYASRATWGSRAVRHGLEYATTSGSFETLLCGEDSTLTGSSGILAKMDNSYTITTIRSSLHDGVKPSLVQYRNLVFFFNGYENFLYDGSTTRQIGITAPTTAPVFSGNIAGDLNTDGSYLFAYTYYNSVTGAESSSSDPSEVMTTGSDAATAGFTITVSAGDASTADTIRYYRTVSGGSTFFLDSTSSISTTSHNITVADSALSTQLEPDNERLPEPGKYATALDNRIFVAGFGSNKNRVHFSKIGVSGSMPESFQAADFCDCDQTDGDQIIGLGATKSQVIVLKERSVGRLVRIQANVGGVETAGSQKYLYERIANDITGVANGGMVTLDNIVIWLGKNEIFGTDGITLYRFGARIYNTLLSLDYTKGYKISALNKADTKQIIFSVIRSGQTEPDFQLVGHYRNFADKGIIAWTFYSPGTSSTTHPGLQMGSIFRVTENGQNAYYFGNSSFNGKIYKMDHGTNDDTYGIYFDVRLPWYAANLAASQKMYHSYYTFAAGSGSTTYALTHTFEKNRSEAVVKTQSINLSNTGGTAWPTGSWASFTWASLEYTPMRFFPHVRAYYGRYGFNNINADQPVAVQSITQVVQIDPI